MAVEHSTETQKRRFPPQDPHSILSTLESVERLPRPGEEGLDIFPQWWVKDFTSILEGKKGINVDFDTPVRDPHVLIPIDGEFKPTIYFPPEYKYGVQHDMQKVQVVATLLGAIYWGEYMKIEEAVYIWKGLPYLESELQIQGFERRTPDGKESLPHVIGIEKTTRDGNQFRKDVQAFVGDLLMSEEIWDQAQQLAEDLIAKGEVGRRKSLTPAAIERTAIDILEGRVDGIEGMQFPEGFARRWVRNEEERGYAWKWLRAYP